MEIHTNITRKDLVEFQIFHRLRSSRQRFRRLAYILVPLLAVIGAVLWWIVPAHARLAYTPALLLTVPLYLAISYYLARRKLARQLDHLSDRAQKSLGEYVITMAETGITIVHDSKESVRSWEEICRVIADSDYCYLYTHPEEALILPHSAFPDDVSFRTFVKLAVIYHWQKEADKAARLAPGISVQAAT